MRAVLLLCCVLCLAGPSRESAAQEPELWVTDSRAAAQRLGGRLMAELTLALADSPVAAIRVCSERAPAIAAEESAAIGASIGRTAVRFRNPANQAQDWQRRGIEFFARRLAAGAEPASLEYTEVATIEDVTEKRWMKPIMTAPLCLTCHGSELSPDTAAAISRHYPQDRATGFSSGELRGAFYVAWRTQPRE